MTFSRPGYPFPAPSFDDIHQRRRAALRSKFLHLKCQRSSEYHQSNDINNEMRICAEYQNWMKYLTGDRCLETAVSWGDHSDGGFEDVASAEQELRGRKSLTPVATDKASVKAPHRARAMLFDPRPDCRRDSSPPQLERRNLLVAQAAAKGITNPKLLGS
jgi:hypothetical protein